MMDRLGLIGCLRRVRVRVRVRVQLREFEYVHNVEMNKHDNESKESLLSLPIYIFINPFNPPDHNPPHKLLGGPVINPSRPTAEPHRA